MSRWCLKQPPWTIMLRNVLGVILILIGTVLWITPIVPGLFLAVIGLLLIDFPGKRALLLRLRKNRYVARYLPPEAGREP